MTEPVTIIDRNVLRVLSAETRMDILKELSKGSRMPSDLGKKLKKSDATIVEHLDVLCKAGIAAKIEQPGKKWIFYTLTEKGEGIVDSKSRRLVIVLGVSVISAVAGFTGLWSSMLGQGLYSRSIEAVSGAQKALVPDAAAGSVAVQAPWVLYFSAALLVLSFAGMAYYLVQKRSWSR